MEKLFKKRITLGQLAQDIEIFNDDNICEAIKLTFYNNDLEEIYTTEFNNEDENLASEFYQYYVEEEDLTFPLLLDFLQSDVLKDLKVKKLDYDEEESEILFYLDEDIDSLNIKKTSDNKYETYITLKDMGVQIYLGGQIALSKEHLIEAIKNKLSNSLNDLNEYIFNELGNDRSNPITIERINCDFDKMVITIKENR